MIESRSIALPGCLGVESCVGRRLHTALLQLVAEGLIDPFDPVVALLIVAIDRPFDCRDLGIARFAAPRDIFFMPEEEVELVLLADDSQEPFVRVVQLVFRVPAIDRLAGVSQRSVRPTGRPDSP